MSCAYEMKNLNQDEIFGTFYKKNCKKKSNGIIYITGNDLKQLIIYMLIGKVLIIYSIVE